MSELGVKPLVCGLVNMIMLKKTTKGRYSQTLNCDKNMNQTGGLPFQSHAFLTYLPWPSFPFYRVLWFYNFTILASLLLTDMNHNSHGCWKSLLVLQLSSSSCVPTAIWSAGITCFHMWFSLSTLDVQIENAC